MVLEVYALLATAAAVAVAVRAKRLAQALRAEQQRYPVVARPKPQRGDWQAPTPDPNRYQVVFHYAGQTRELYHGYDGLKARHAFENAPMEAGVVAEFYEWGALRGTKEA